LHSEFGVEGITNLKTLNATIAPEHQQPVTLDNPIWHHLGAWWVKQPMWQATFGEITDIETLVKATQMMQAEGLRYAVEANRRRKWHTSGTLPWQFNEPYPMAACTSAVDYYGRPKPVYYAVAQAYKPLHLSASFPMVAWEGEKDFIAGVWLHNSLEEMPHVYLLMEIFGLSGDEYWAASKKVASGTNSATMLSTIRWPLAELKEDVFILNLTLSNRYEDLIRTRYVFTRTATLAPLLAAKPTKLEIHLTDRADEWSVYITNEGDVTALFLWLEDGRDLNARGSVYFNKNHFCLFPVDNQIFWVYWQDVPPEERRITISGWNVETRTIT
jgi:beta-mannosidase